MEAAARRCGRQPGEVRLVAATKGVTPSRIREAIAAGVREIGENYVQEAIPKLNELEDLRLVRHFIGHLQRNKAGAAVGAFEVIQSLDSPALAQAIARRARDLGREVDVLVEVNVAGDGGKTGVAPETALSLAEVAALSSGLRLRGLMGMAPFEGGDRSARDAFRRLRALYERLPRENQEILSMGMTGDFEVAIEEGSTMIRIGTGIFGQRRTHPDE